MATPYSFEVQNINARDVNTKYGPKKAYDIIATDGTKYGFAFTDPAKNGIHVGSVVSALGESDRFGIKLDPKTAVVGGSVKSVASGTDTISAKPASSGGWKDKVFPVPNTHGDTAIIRQNALTNAVATVADFVATQPTEKWPSLDTWTDMVITTAYKYAEFSSGHRELKALKSLHSIGVPTDNIAADVDAHLNYDPQATQEVA